MKHTIENEYVQQLLEVLFVDSKYGYIFTRVILCSPMQKVSQKNIVESINQSRVMFMSTLGIMYALITVLVWGAWLAPSENVPMKGQQTQTFYLTLVVMLLIPVITENKLITGSSADPFMVCLHPEDDSVIWRIFTGGGDVGKCTCHIRE